MARQKASLKFMELPVEMLDKIADFALPEAFESLTLTCKTWKYICEQHPYDRELYLMWRNLSYYQPKSVEAGNICTVNVLTRIFEEPVIGRLIKNADFSIDATTRASWPHAREEDFIVEGATDAVYKLIHSSPYVKEAGLDPGEYMEEIRNDIWHKGFSQYAAALLLTLLPNLEFFKPPRLWMSKPITDELLKAYVARTNWCDMEVLDENFVTGGRMSWSSDPKWIAVEKGRGKARPLLRGWSDG